MKFLTPADIDLETFLVIGRLEFLMAPIFRFGSENQQYVVIMSQLITPEDCNL